MNRNEFDAFVSAVLNGRLSRREVLHRGAALGLTTTVLTSLLAVSEGATAAVQESTEGRPPEEATGEEAILNFGAIQEPVTLDPHLSTSVSDTMLMNVYAKLVDVDRDTGEIIPELAREWEVSPDGLTVILRLQEGVVFHDGTPFNAEAARINFERCIALNSNIAEAFTAIASMQVVDESTLAVTLKAPLAPWVAMLSKNPKMISPTAITEHIQGDDFAQAWLAENTAGSGAYVHVRWDRGSNLQWEAFPRFWRGWEGKHVTTVNNRIILEPGTQRLQVEAGDLDVQMLYTQETLTALRSNPDLNVMFVNQPNILYIRLNNFTGPTADKRVRQAISYGFDYDGYAGLLNIEPSPPRADMPIPVQLYGAGYQAVEIPYYTYDPERALSLLQEAGYGEGFTMNLFTDSSSPQKPLLAELFQAYMAALNIQVEITVEPFANILARGTDQALQRNWETAIHSWVLYTPPQYPDPSSFLLRMYNPYPNSIRNLLGYVNEEVARLTQEGVTQTDPAAALERYWQANLLIVEDCPDLILDRSTQFEILRTWTKGHRPHISEPWRWTYWNVWKEMV